MGGGKAKVVQVPLPPTTRQWTPRERAIVELHLHYLTQVWSVSDWKIYNQYKKHLAPEHRAEVDRLLDMILIGKPGPFRELHETIMAAIWDATDWLAVLDDPKACDFDDAEQRAAWEARVARVRAIE